MIFCSKCGAMRHKPAPREARSPAPEAPPPPLPMPSGPRFYGTAGSFAGRWLGSLMVVAFLVWILQSLVLGRVLSKLYQSHGMFGYRLVSVLLWNTLGGAAWGWVQSGVLSRSLQWRRFGWGWATLAGTLLGGLATLVQPESSWQDRSPANTLLWYGFFGVLSGGITGVLQALALRKLGPARWMLFWPLVAVGANVLGNLAGIGSWQLLMRDSAAHSRFYLLAGMMHTLTDTLITALPSGIVLGACLRRQFGQEGSPLDDPEPE